MKIKIKFKEFEIILWKKDAFDCAGIQAQVFWLMVESELLRRPTFYVESTVHKQTG